MHNNKMASKHLNKRWLSFISGAVVFALTMSISITSCDLTDTSSSTTVTLNPNPLTYYVSASASDDSSDGLSQASAFKTIKKAANVSLPGDTILVMNGTYRKPQYEGSVLNITRSGTNRQYITYKAMDGHSPVIQVLKEDQIWNAVSINASYIHFEGFELVGDNDNLNLSDAEASYDHALAAGESPDDALLPDWPHYSQFNTNGISIGGPSKQSMLPRHVIIKKCIVHDFPGGGISAIQADYVTFEGNRVYNNAWYMMYAGSGISILNPINSDYNTGLKNIVRGNYVHNNETRVKWLGEGILSDGNGIIIDVNLTPYANGVAPDNRAYTGRTLVENNVSFNNGGSGIHAYKANHVDIINNTAFNNRRVMTGYKDIFINGTKENNVYVSGLDCRVINNIIYAQDIDSYNQDIPAVPSQLYAYNMYYNVTLSGAGKGSDHEFLDPKFVNLSTDPTVADFRLKADSPAKNVGWSTVYASIDHLGISRPQGSGPDMGAYEAP